ncbi:MAG: glycine zipper 2TM domain-containing protein [Allopontixanthobacter sediminis]
MTIKSKTFAALALAIPAFAMSAPAMAVAPMQAPQSVSYGAASVHADPVFENGRDRYDRRYNRGRGHDRYDRRDSRDYRNQGYRGDDYGHEVRRDTRIWRDRDGRYRCQRDDGTTGLLIGGAVGGLLGNEVAGRGDKTLGAILGAAGGAILGRSIDRSNSRCR